MHLSLLAIVLPMNSSTLAQEAHPRTDVNNVPGYHTSPLPHQVFQGAPPDAQRSSSRFRSRTVSIGCQNPWCS